MGNTVTYQIDHEALLYSGHNQKWRFVVRHTVHTEHVGTVMIGDAQVDGRFNLTGTVVVKVPDSNPIGLSYSEALHLASVLIDTVRTMQDNQQ